MSIAARALPFCLLALPFCLPGQTASAQPVTQPQPLPLPPAIATPQDTPYPGTIELAVDATDLSHHVFRIHEDVPVQQAGDFVLLFPKWIPGNHSPTGPIPTLGGLVIKSGDQRLAWTRDVVQEYAFHINVPQGATSLSVDFDYLSPLDDEKEGRVVMTPNMLDVQWNPEVLYPAGHFARQITLHPKLTLPDGWQYGTALETENATGGHITFKPTTLNTLIDSPVYAGRYSARIDLAPGAATPVHLNIFADRPQDLAISPDQLAKHRALVQQAVRLFGAQHYAHYDFLFALSDALGGVGLEHHQSSEDGVGRDYFTNWDQTAAYRDLLPHEYTHSWNGKFRRPADLWAPNFNVPERDSLLWVYEGQTQFWGQILAARSGLWNHAEALDAIADDAASMQAEIGRLWRPLQDTTNDPVINARRPQPWHSWERQEDYYTEGLLIWLDADTLIREQTNNGAKSLGDFARAFFGIEDGSFVTAPSTSSRMWWHALNGVMPYDWSGFLRTRLDGNPPVHRWTV